MTTIEKSKNIDIMWIDELIGSLQAYEITLLSSIKLRGVAIKTSKKNESKDESELVLTPSEISMFTKKLKNYMKLQKKANLKEH